MDTKTFLLLPMGRPAFKGLPAKKAPDREFTALRNAMVEQHIEPLGVDSRIVKAFFDVPRHLFVPQSLRSLAYVDTALPIGHEQTISQPSLVALMTAALELKGHEKVLEVGTGSGYQAAILSRLVREVYSIEIVGPLAVTAAALLEQLGYDNVHVVRADGTAGLPEQAPFDAIIVTAGGPRIPAPLSDQLKDGGRLVIPLGADSEQELLLGHKRDGAITLEDLGGVRFVPLHGEYA